MNKDSKPLTEEQILAALVDGQKPSQQPIRLCDYDPNWPALFQKEADRISAALGRQVLALEHIGSTSVPGLSAKPIIDMLLVVSDSSNEAAYVPQLEAAGYVLRIREPDWYEHRLLKGPEQDINLHVYSSGCPEINRNLVFRDWLRSNEGDRLLYENTKKELAKKDWKFVQNYADAKTAVVEEIIARASNAICVEHTQQ
jgi:GrpB-like predicted nucleotidyltransferase (UPF0157 family)